MCYPVDDFRIGPSDVKLGEIDGALVYMSGQWPRKTIFNDQELKQLEATISMFPNKVSAA